MTGPATPNSVRHRIMMAFLVVIVSWGIVLALAINSSFERILLAQHLPAAVVAEIGRHFILVCSGLTLAGFVLFYFVARYLAQAVVEPVQQLMAGIESLHHGELQTRVPVRGNDEFAALATAFNRMAEKLGEVDRLKAEFVSTVSHELRTPLACIVGYTELLQHLEPGHEEAAEYLAVIGRKADELTTLVEGLLDLSRIEAGIGLQLQLSDFDLAELAGDCLAQARLLSTRHRFDYRGPEVPLLVTADRLRIKQILDNLLVNAVKYSTGGSVALTLTVNGPSALLVVSDEGIGMNEEQRARACEKFYRVNAADSAVSGAGLGLSIVRNNLLAHHGTLHIDSAPGRGTAVTVSLPLKPPRDNRG